MKHLITLIRRWFDRCRQPQPQYLGEYEYTLLMSNQKLRDGRLNHNEYRNE